MTKPKKSSFEAVFPNITLWVNDCGTVEVGYDPSTDTFIRAIDEGGMVWSGEEPLREPRRCFAGLGGGARADPRGAGTRRRAFAQ